MSLASGKTTDIYLPEPATALKVEPMTELEAFFQFRLDSGRELGHMPGQFAEVSVPGFGEAPISISSSPTQNGHFEMVVRKVGNLTGALHRLQEGEKVGIRGPFGTAFPVEDELPGRDVLFICGGIGLVPLRSAIRYVLDRRDEYGKVTILSGTKTPADRLFTDELADWRGRDDVDFRETVDRADEQWDGNVGVITTLMPELELDAEATRAVVCGPPVMYKFVVWELYKMGLTGEQVFVSLERRMKCGVGKCGHCQVDGIYVCQEGPVFRLDEIEGAREAIQ